MHVNIALLSAVPVVDIDGTFFVQAGIFLLLLVILKSLLFQPWLEVQAKRHEKIEGALQHSDELSEKVSSMQRDYDSKLANAREQAMALRSDARKEAEEEREAKVSKVRAEAGQTLELERVRIDGELAEARRDLEGRVGELSREITGKIVGRAI